jgi:hypothetical protein
VARLTRTTCDRCDAVIEAGRAVLTIEAGPALPWAPHERSGRPAVDLCPPCLAGLVEWLAPSRVVKAAG